MQLTSALHGVSHAILMTLGGPEVTASMTSPLQTYVYRGHGQGSM